MCWENERFTFMLRLCRCLAAAKPAAPEPIITTDSYQTQNINNKIKHVVLIVKMINIWVNSLKADYISFYGHGLNTIDFN